MNSWIWSQSGIHDGHRAWCATTVIAVRFSLFRNVVPPALVIAVGEGRLSRRRTSLASRASDPLERSTWPPKRVVQNWSHQAESSLRSFCHATCGLIHIQQYIRRLYPLGKNTYSSLSSSLEKNIFTFSITVLFTKAIVNSPDDEPGSCVLPSASVKVPVQFGSMRLSNTSH
jgi:hypothetical protein